MSALLAAAAQAAAVPIDALTGPAGILLLAPHPDDETLGCGAALAAAAASGRRTEIVLVTDGSRSHRASRSHPPARLAALRAAELAAALALLVPGAPPPLALGHRDTEAPEGEAALAAAAARIAPRLEGVSAIWAPWEGDPHVDHVRTAALARRLAASAGLPLWSYPIWGRFEPVAPVPPPERIAVFPAGERRALKAAALACHRSQMTRLIADDPDGFVMPAAQQAHFLDHPEIFIRG